MTEKLLEAYKEIDVGGSVEACSTDVQKYYVERKPLLECLRKMTIEKRDISDRFFIAGIEGSFPINALLDENWLAESEVAESKDGR